MMQSVLFLVILLTIQNNVSAQLVLNDAVQQDIVLHGLVVEQNSKFNTGEVNYLSNATIKSPGSAPKHSDVNGKFNLVFSDKPIGNLTRVYVSKNDFEVVNNEELKNAAVLGRKAPLKVVMCEEGQLYENQVTYYKIADSTAKANYNRRIAILSKEGKEKDLLLAELQVEFNQRITSVEKAKKLLDKQLKIAQQQAKELADKWVTVNLDDQSTSYQKAFRAFKAKDINRALTILDSIDIKKRLEINTRERQREQKLIDTLKNSIVKRDQQIVQDVNQCVFQAELHMLKNEFDKTDELYETAVKYDSLNNNLIFKYAHFLHKQNKFIKAKQYYSKILRVYKALAKKNPNIYLPYVADTLNNLGILLSKTNNLHEAKLVYQEALEIRRVLSNKNPDVYLPALADTLNNLGILLKKNKELTKAKKAYEESLKISKRLSNNNSWVYLSDLSMSLNNLGVLEELTNNQIEAELLYEKALEIRRTLSKKNPNRYLADLAMSLNNLGGFLTNNNRLIKAESLFKESVKIYRVLSEKNPNRYLPFLAHTLNNLSTLLRKINKLIDSKKANIESLKIYRTLAEKYPDVYLSEIAIVLNDFGNLLCDTNEMHEAKLAYEESLEIRRTLSEKNPDVYLSEVAMVLNNLGVLFHDINKIVEAKSAYEESIEIKKALSKKNPDVYLPGLAMTLNNLGDLLEDTNKIVDARLAFEEALSIRRNLSKKNPDVYLSEVASSLNRLGGFLSDINKIVDAKSAYEESLKIRRTLSEKNPDVYLSGVAMVLNNLGLLSRKTNKKLEAQLYYEECLDFLKILANTDPIKHNIEICEVSISLSILYKEKIQNSGDTHIKESGIHLMKEAKRRLSKYPDNNPKVKNYTELIKILSSFFENFSEENFLIEKSIKEVLEYEEKNKAEKDPKERVNNQNKVIEMLESTLKEYPQNTKLLSRISNTYGTLAWYYIFNRQFIEAEQAALHGLELDQNQKWINTNLALSLLYQNKLEEAKKIYLKMKDLPYGDGTYTKVFLEDLDALEKEGISCKGIIEIRRLLKK